MARHHRSTRRRGMNLIGLLRRTVSTSTGAVRRVGKLTRKTLKRGTNLVGITRKRRASRRQHH
jgi:hypothetical protein